ncbi:unnamed protein product [Polarella glacialis]|uniref:Uncharacterized protein n=1 Tax=Polarella glacialis TaxID=89957 RepID=A0A813IFK1_POLGL|nr:unnamed protein product [Polarella glacialis]
MDGLSSGLDEEEVDAVIFTAALHAGHKGSAAASFPSRRCLFHLYCTAIGKRHILQQPQFLPAHGCCCCSC